MGKDTEVKNQKNPQHSPDRHNTNLWLELHFDLELIESTAGLCLKEC